MKRFLSPKVGFSAAELRYLTEVDEHDHIAYVAWRATSSSRSPAASHRARHRRHGDRRRRSLAGPRPRPPAAAAARRRAAEEGITRFAGTMLADNRPALRLMRGFATPLERDEISHGVREMVTRLAA